MSCAHACEYRGLCADCGADVSLLKRPTTSVGGQHSVSLTSTSLSTLTSSNTSSLLSSSKLLLALDLDHTVVHASADRSLTTLPAALDIHRFSLGAHNHFLKLRAGALDFLVRLCELYDIHVFTLGIREYAIEVIKVLDPANVVKTVIARDDFMVGNALPQKTLERLFPCDQRMAMIVDDDPRVWSTHSRNVLPIHKFHYFSTAAEFAHGKTQRNKRGMEDDQGKTVEQYEEAALDNVLGSFQVVLEAVHDVFYHTQLEEYRDKVDGRDILSLIREQVFAGLCLCFTGVIAKGIEVSSSREVGLAKLFGGQVSDHLDQATHLVVARADSSKHRAARKRAHVEVVDVSWFWTCVTHWCRVDEDLFRDIGTKARATHCPVAPQSRSALVDRVLPVYKASLELADDFEAELELMFDL